MFSANDKILAGLVWRGTHTGSYGGVETAGKPVEVFWRGKDGKVIEISTSGISSRFLSRLGTFRKMSMRRRPRAEGAQRASDLLNRHQLPAARTHYLVAM
jgi:hypothetical protein